MMLPRITEVLHYRAARAKHRPAGSGRTRKAPSLIAGRILEGTLAVSPEFRRTLNERRDLIEARVYARLDIVLGERPRLDATLRPELVDNYFTEFTEA